MTGSFPTQLNDEQLQKLLVRLEQLVQDGEASLDDYGELARAQAEWSRRCQALVRGLAQDVGEEELGDEINCRHSDA